MEDINATPVNKNNLSQRATFHWFDFPELPLKYEIQEVEKEYKSYDIIENRKSTSIDTSQLDLHHTAQFAITHQTDIIFNTFYPFQEDISLLRYLNTLHKSLRFTKDIIFYDFPSFQLSEIDLIINILEYKSTLKKRKNRRKKEGSKNKIRKNEITNLDRERSARSRKRASAIDVKFLEAVGMIQKLRSEGMKHDSIADKLNKLGRTTIQARPFKLHTVKRYIKLGKEFDERFERSVYMETGKKRVAFSDADLQENTEHNIIISGIKDRDKIDYDGTNDKLSFTLSAKNEDIRAYQIQIYNQGVMIHEESSEGIVEIDLYDLFFLPGRYYIKIMDTEGRYKTDFSFFYGQNLKKIIDKYKNGEFTLLPLA